MTTDYPDIDHTIIRLRSADEDSGCNCHMVCHIPLLPFLSEARLRTRQKIYPSMANTECQNEGTRGQGKELWMSVSCVLPGWFANAPYVFCATTTNGNRTLFELAEMN